VFVFDVEVFGGEGEKGWFANGLRFVTFLIERTHFTILFITENK
jgi:hypothetical protein